MLPEPSRNQDVSPLIDNRINPVRMAIGLYTVDDVAAALEKSPATIKKWIAQRRLPSSREGNKTYIRASDLKKWVDSLGVDHPWVLRNANEN